MQTVKQGSVHTHQISGISELEILRVLKDGLQMEPAEGPTTS